MSIKDKISDLVTNALNESVTEDEFNLEDYTLEEIQEFIESEEYEQLDELSKATLGNYVKKASKNMANAQADAADQSNVSNVRGKAYKTAVKRDKGISKAVNKLTNEETDMENQEQEVKLDITEDMNALFNGEETLTEEFKTKAATIFEAAVVARVKSEVETLEEEFAQRLDEQVEEVKAGLVENVDGFLNYMVEQWMSDNEVALESGIKAEITENIVNGLHQLFAENFITVPDEKVDIVETLEESVAELQLELRNAINANIDLNKTINETKRAGLVEKFCSELTTVDAEKFRNLVEELSFDDAETFESKLVTIKENYFAKSASATKAAITESIVTDSPVDVLTENTEPKKVVDPKMAAILKHLNK